MRSLPTYPRPAVGGMTGGGSKVQDYFFLMEIVTVPSAWRTAFVDPSSYRWRSVAGAFFCVPASLLEEEPDEEDVWLALSI